MAWGYWSATAIDRGRSPRRNTQCSGSVPPINEVPQSEPPIPTCYSPCRSRCSSPCHSPCSAADDSPCPESPPQTPQQQQQQHTTNVEYSRRPSSVDRLDSPQVCSLSLSLSRYILSVRFHLHHLSYYNILTSLVHTVLRLRHSGKSTVRHIVSRCNGVIDSIDQ